jgi:hypothetical protein
VCLDIRAIWSMDHPTNKLLVFADPATLQRLRRADELHCADFEVLVVVDGDAFESAWGQHRVVGSLARWAWRQASAAHAYYDESRWAGRDDDPGDGVRGDVVRVRRKATLMWQSQSAPA